MKAFAEPNQQDLFHNQVAIVTGAANGIGRSIAIALAHAGAHVVIADTDATNGMVVAEQIRQTQRTALMVRTDVSQEQDHLLSLVHPEY